MNDVLRQMADDLAATADLDSLDRAARYLQLRHEALRARLKGQLDYALRMERLSDVVLDAPTMCRVYVGGQTYDVAIDDLEASDEQ